MWTTGPFKIQYNVYNANVQLLFVVPPLLHITKIAKLKKKMEMWVNSDFSKVVIKDSQGICCYASFSKPVTLATMIHFLQATQNPKDQV